MSDDIQVFRRKLDMHWAIYCGLTIITLGIYAFYFSRQMNRVLQAVTENRSTPLTGTDTHRHLHLYLTMSLGGMLGGMILSGVFSLWHPELKHTMAYALWSETMKAIWLTGGYAWAFKMRTALRDYYATHHGIEFQPNGILMLLFPNLTLLYKLNNVEMIPLETHQKGDALSTRLNLHCGIYVLLTLATGGGYCLVMMYEIVCGLSSQLNIDRSKVSPLKGYVLALLALNVLMLMCARFAGGDTILLSALGLCVVSFLIFAAWGFEVRGLLLGHGRQQEGKHRRINPFCLFFCPCMTLLYASNNPTYRQ